MRWAEGQGMICDEGLRAWVAWVRGSKAMETEMRNVAECV